MNEHDFARALMGETVPLGEAAAFFVGIKKFGAPTELPDETGALEGQFDVPVVQVLTLLAELVKNEFETIYAYTAYAQTLRDLAHDSIAEHFQSHADEEHDHADFLLKRMAVLGGGANLPDLAAPHPSTDPCDIIQTMIRMEQEGIAGWHKLLTIVGDNPMRIKAEEYMAAEQEHLDDLRQLMPAVANPEQMTATPALPPPDAVAPGAEKPKASKKERGGDLVGKIAAAVLKQANVFEEGTPNPTGDPADSMIQRYAGKGDFDRATSRRPEATLAWNAQGERTKSAAIEKMAWALKRAFGEMASGNANAAMAGGSQQGTTGGTGTTTAPGGPAADEMGSEQPAAPPMPPTQSSANDPALSSFLSAEHAGTMAELQAQAGYYKQLSDQAQQAAQGTAEQLQQVQQQATDLQQQVQMSQQQIDQAMQQSQQVQQSAMQTAQSAQQIAAQSQQAHLQASNEAMMHKQLSEQMRASVMQMKANIQSALQNDPTQGIEMQLGATGQPAGPPMAGAGPAAAGPEAQPGGPAANAPDQQMDPGAVPPEGEPNASAPVQPGGGPAMDGAEPAGELKTSGAKMKAIAAELKKRAPYMAGGAAIGVGATALGRPHSGKTKKDVDEAEAKGGGPVRDLNTARHKMRHAVAEYVDKHPVAGSALIGAAAANTAGQAGPTIKKVVSGYLKHRKAGK